MKKINSGEKVSEAVIKGSQERLRAVLLTSFTTIAGLTPLLFEKKLQAQFFKAYGCHHSIWIIVIYFISAHTNTSTDISWK